MRNCVIWIRACWTHANALGSKSPHEKLLNMWNDMFFMRSFPRYPRSKRLGAAVQPSAAAFWLLRTTCYPLHWWPRQPTETEDGDWWFRRGHHLDLSWHDWNWQLDPFGSIWILHHLGTSCKLGFDPWSELKPVMKSLRHVVTVMSTIFFMFLFGIRLYRFPSPMLEEVTVSQCACICHPIPAHSTSWHPLRIVYLYQFGLPFWGVWHHVACLLI